jgi:3-hydroxyacyl-[acyl-carrier-protein] dehydratase
LRRTNPLGLQSMRFTQLDRIIELEPQRRVVAIKSLSLAEEYLADHFPRFPVMPGVLMLEALYQASAWLILMSEDFVPTMVVLKEARNVKYAGFVEPGRVLTVQAEIQKQDEQTTSLKASASLDGEKDAVSARLVLERFSAEDRYPLRGCKDEYIRRGLRETFAKLYRPKQSVAGTA